MCTATYIPVSQKDFVLTFNRDESPGRETLFPDFYEEGGKRLLYPKDAVAGGTWIGISDNQRMVCLMNGAFEAHVRKPSYRKSRGLVVKDFLIFEDLDSELENYDLKGVEPFRSLVIDWRDELKLTELVWDEEKLHRLDRNQKPCIWSSSPLYPKDLREKRRTWFSVFLQQFPHPSFDEILNFHKTSGEGNPVSNLVMDRGVVKTKSITQVVKLGKKIKLYYEDLESGKKTELDY